MCGIFGIVVDRSAEVKGGDLRAVVEDLFRLSESRGKEAAGIALNDLRAIHVYKEALPAHAFIRQIAYRQLATRLITHRAKSNSPLSVIGHSRLVTNGTMEIGGNNQPVIKDGLVGIHNGIIVNDAALWRQHPTLARTHEVDTEILLSLVHAAYRRSGLFVDAVREAYQEIEGTASVAMFVENLPVLVLATNNGSLYLATSVNGGRHIFASERYILQTLIRRAYVRRQLGDFEIRQIEPNRGVCIAIVSGECIEFSLNGAAQPVLSPKPEPASPIYLIPEQHAPHASPATPVALPKRALACFEVNFVPIDRLRRCTRCILPETMPFIDFDDAGVCNYCRNYTPLRSRGEDALHELADRYRSHDGYPDCIVTFSGGRDSSFGVHYVTTELNLHPITYTYDWGMVTDLARRNQARLCGELGLEHILISADIQRKRANIRKNVLAWLRRPDLGTVPLFHGG